MKKERLKPNILTKQPIQGLLQESLQQKKNWIKVTLLDLWLWLSQKPKTWAFFDKERFIQEIYIVLKLWNLSFKISSLIPSAWCIGLISNLMTCDMSGVTQFCFISIINLRKSRISSVYITASPTKYFEINLQNLVNFNFYRRWNIWLCSNLLPLLANFYVCRGYWELGYACPQFWNFL